MSEQTQLQTQFGNIYANTEMGALLTSDFYTKSEIETKLSKISSDTYITQTTNDLQNKINELSNSINDKSNIGHKHQTTDITNFDSKIQDQYINNINNRLSSIEDLMNEINNKLDEII